MSEKAFLSSEQIERLLPHRAPMLLVDRVLSIGETEIVGTKLVSASEPFFQGHFPGRPIMPGVLILEALAQLACIGLVYRDPSRRGLVPVLAGIDKARFRRLAEPGDLLVLSVRVDRERTRLVRLEGRAEVDGETVASAAFLASFVQQSA
jgi:beta-hydroxyacyl-ACP dehydratase FabZ